MMFIAAILTGSILGYAAAGLALLLGMPYTIAFAALLAVGMLGALMTVGLSILQAVEPSEDLALA